MSSANSIFSRSTVVFCYLAFLIILGLPSDLLAQSDSGIWSRLEEKAQTSGRVRVILQLKEEGDSLPDLSTPQARSNRQQKVRKLQDKFINELADQGYSLQKIKRFGYLSHLALSVSPEELAALKNHSLVVGIQEDKLNRASLDDSVPLIGADQVVAVESRYRIRFPAEKGLVELGDHGSVGSHELPMHDLVGHHLLLPSCRTQRTRRDPPCAPDAREWFRRVARHYRSRRPLGAAVNQSLLRPIENPCARRG